MDGLETLRRMRLVRADACVIMVTAYATIELAVDAMKLGATDFVRKPMTPDTLRQAVAAALAKRDRASPSQEPADRPASSALAKIATPQLPPIEIWTTNRFFIRARLGGSRRPIRRRRSTTSSSGEGRKAPRVEVVGSIDAQAVARIARECRRSLRPSGAFWRKQAESALVNYLWNEAEPPEGGRLVVSRVTGPMLDAAVGWTGD